MALYAYVAVLGPVLEFPTDFRVADARQNARISHRIGSESTFAGRGGLPYPLAPLCTLG